MTGYFTLIVIMQLNKRFIPWFSWGISTTFVLIQFFLQAAAGLMAHSWQGEFNLTPSELGYLTAAFYYSYVFMQIPVGLCYDRFSARRVLCIASLSLCMGVIGLSISHFFWQAFFARVLMGIGSSFGFVGMLCITSAWFSTQRFTLLIGISETLAMLGVALIEILMSWVIAHYGWRIMMLISGGVIGMLYLLILLVVQDPEKPKLILDNHYSVGKSIRQVLGSTLVWQAGLYGFAVFAIINVVVALWGVPFLNFYYPSYSLQLAGLLMSMVFVGTAIGAPLNGWLALYFKRSNIMQWFALMSLGLFACVLYIDNLSTITLGLLLGLIGFFSSSYIQVFALIREGVDKKLQATALATTNMILMASAPILQPLIGYLQELHFSLRQSLSIIELSLVGALFVTYFLRKADKTKINEKR